jgi:hypothetical protein
MGLKQTGCRVWTGFNYLRIGTMAGFWDHSSEFSGSKEGGEFLDHVKGCQLLKLDSAPGTGGYR